MREHHDLVEQYLIEFPGSSSLTLFREVYGNDSEGDHWHSQWVRFGFIENKVAGHLEALLNKKALERLNA